MFCCFSKISIDVSNKNDVDSTIGKFSLYKNCKKINF